MGLEGKCIYEIMEMQGKGLTSMITLEPEGLKLLSAMLRHSPLKRISPIEAMQSPYFDEIRNHPMCVLND